MNRGCRTGCENNVGDEENYINFCVLGSNSGVRNDARGAT